MYPGTTISLSTVRIVAHAGAQASVGTGYFYGFETEKGDYAAVITNKHVIGSATSLSLVLSLKPVGAEVRADGSADGEYAYPVEFNYFRPTFFVEHPEPNVDLCAVLIGPLLRNLPPGMELKSSFLFRSWQLDEEDRSITRPIEPVVMVGYPSGLWDETSNRPITRQGLTASHPLLNWNGRREFVVDVACFPGSSGSPVFLYEDGLFRQGIGYSPGTRAKLLGTLWGGPTVSSTGRLEARAIPTSIVPVPVIETMMNLGFVIHASAIDDLLPVIKSRFAHS